MSADIKYAVATSIDHVQSLLGNIRDLRLEEVEKTRDGEGWLVTISFVPMPNLENGALAALLAKDREYKQIEIDELGQPIAMRIRKIE